MKKNYTMGELTDTIRRLYSIDSISISIEKSFFRISRAHTSAILNKSYELQIFDLFSLPILRKQTYRAACEFLQLLAMEKNAN